MINKYRLGFNVGGVILFLIIMIPNFIWFVAPAPHDILRSDSTTTLLDSIASVCQVLMIMVLCLVKSKECPRFKLKSPFIILTLINCLMYFGMWGLYYLGITFPYIIIGLCLFPCLAFILYAIDRRNLIAAILAGLFTICHLAYGIINFII